MITIGDVNVWAKHVVIADLDVAAGIDHQVSIEIVPVANPYSDPVERSRPPAKASSLA